MKTAINSSVDNNLALAITPYNNFDAEEHRLLNPDLVQTRLFPVDAPLSAIDLLADNSNDVRQTTIMDTNVFDDLLVLPDGIFRVVV